MMDPDKRFELEQRLGAKLEQRRTTLTETVSVGGGAVEVTVDRVKPLQRVRLDGENCRGLDADDVGGLVVAAFNEAARRAVHGRGVQRAMEIKAELGGGLIGPPALDPVG